MEAKNLTDRLKKLNEADISKELLKMGDNAIMKLTGVDEDNIDYVVAQVLGYSESVGNKFKNAKEAIAAFLKFHKVDGKDGAKLIKAMDKNQFKANESVNEGASSFVTVFDEKLPALVQEVLLELGKKVKVGKVGLGKQSSKGETVTYKESRIEDSKGEVIGHYDVGLSFSADKTGHAVQAKITLTEV